MNALKSVVRIAFVFLFMLSLVGCTASDARLARAMQDMTDWVDGVAPCAGDDGKVEDHMTALPKLTRNLQKVLETRGPAERAAALAVLRQYMYIEFPAMFGGFSEAQQVYLVFGIKREASQLETALGTTEMGNMTGALPADRPATEKEWHQFVATVYDINGNGIPDANDPAMKGALSDLHGLPLQFGPYDHSGLLRHQAGDVGVRARYHGLVPADQEVPAFASVAEAAGFLATNIYLQPVGDTPQAKATAVVDTDKDGLSDASENLGWSVRVYNGVDYDATYKVTSDPTIADTDGDGLLDSEEQQRHSDPRNPDTDSDGISDYDEVHVYGTNPTSVDTDCDCQGWSVLQTSSAGYVYEFADCNPALFDGSELLNQDGPTSPTTWDTDGDNRSDRTEMQQGRSPRVADVPQLQVEVLDAPQLTILDETGSTFEQMDQHLDSTETTHVESSTSGWNIGAKLSGDQGVGVTSSEGGSMNGSVKQGFDLSGGYSSTKETSDTTATKVENMHQTIQTNSQTIKGYKLRTQVKVTNVSNTPLTAKITDLVINCVYQIPNGANPPGIGYLQMEPEGGMTAWSLQPNSSTTLFVSGEEDSASAAADITNVIGSGAPITFTVAQCAMTATDGSPVSSIMENVIQATSSITLDFGPYYPNSPNSATNHKPEAYYVAANIPRIMPDGTVTNGLYLAEALAEVGITDFTMGENGRLMQIQGWPADPAAHPLGGWFIASSSDSLVVNPNNPEFANYGSFDTIWLAGANPNIASAPDFVELYWMDDQDGDGLMDTSEASYGTDPTKTDTDGDGLTDRQEVVGVPAGTAAGALVYYTSPLQADTDGDGLNDAAELEHWHSNPLVPSARVFNAVVGVSTGLVTDMQYWLNADSGANVYPGDFDGDGIGDFIRQQKGGWESTMPMRANNIQVFYGDGKGGFDSVDLLVISRSFSINYFGFDAGCTLFVGDFNGDGRDDVMRQQKGALATQSPQDNTLLCLSDVGRTGSFTYNNFTVSGDLPDWSSYFLYDKGAYMYVGDFNGDGLADIIRQEHGDWAKDSVNTAIVYYASMVGDALHFTSAMMTATGVLSQPQAELKGDKSKLYPGDFNGDGKCDFIRQEFTTYDANIATVYFATDTLGHFNTVALSSTGHLTESQQNLKFDGGATLVVGDFNADGKYDFIRQEHGTWATEDHQDTFLLYTGNGDASFVCSTINTTGNLINPMVELGGDRSTLHPFDFNGDGYCDFLRQGFGANGYNGIDNASIYFTDYTN